jgi:hypothetical protein
MKKHTNNDIGLFVDAGKTKIEPINLQEGKLDIAFNIATKVVPEPYNIAVKAAKVLTGFLFPKPNLVLEKLNKILDQLNKMDEKLDDIKIISSATYDAVKKLALTYAENHYMGIITDLYDANSPIGIKYKSFYDKNIFPLESDNFYRFTKDLCNGGACSTQDMAIITALGGNVPNKTHGSSSEPYQSPAELLYSFIANLDPTKKIWIQLNNAYQDVLNTNKGGNSKENNLVVPYLAAMNPIVDLQLNLISYLQQILIMNQLQVALYYSHREFFDKKPDFPFDVSNELYEYGYEKTLVNMDSKFIKLGYQIKDIFGETNENGTRKDGVIKFRTQANYLNFVTAKDGKDSSKLLDEKNINCWIQDLNMPSAVIGWQSGTISALCKTSSSTSEKLELKRMYFNFAYSVNELHEVAVKNEPNIACKNEYLEANLKDGKLINFEDVVGSEPHNNSKEYPGAWVWVAHTSGALGRYHLVFQKYKIKLDSLSSFTKQVYNNRKPKMNNSSRPLGQEIVKNELCYPEKEGPKYSSSANPDKWMSSAYTKTKNGRGYWVNSYFVKKDYNSRTGVTNAHGQLIFISPLKGDTTCKQSIDKEKETVTLTWESPSGEPTIVSIKTKTNQHCPDNSHTAGGGSGFHCGANVFSVTTEAPETVIQIEIESKK